MRTILLCITLVLVGVVGCNERSESRQGKRASAESGQDLLGDVALAHPAPEELGEDWAYSRGRKGPNDGSTINEGYANNKTSDYVAVVILKRQSVSAAEWWFEGQIKGFKSSAYSGLGEEARVEPRGSRGKPYVLVAFRRRNVVVTLRKAGNDHESALHVAHIIDRKIKVNLK